MKTKTKKLIIIILSVLLFLALIAGLVTTFLLNYNTFAPNAPILFDDGERIYIKSDVNDNYRGYRFKFRTSSNKEVLIDSDDNIITAQEMTEHNIELGKKYYISTCFLAENAGNNSAYSEELVWTSFAYLASPKVSYDSATKLLSWSSVENCDYYKIFTNASEVDFIQTEDNFLDLSTFTPGENTFTVIAYSNKLGYKPSVKSEIIELKIVNYLKGFSSIDFNSETKTILALSEERYESIYIVLNNKQIKINSLTPEEIDGKFVYTIDISIVYNDETTIGIKPCNIDEYNIYVGDCLTYNLQDV